MYSNKYDSIKGKWSGKKYILHKKLGSGGIGEIYLARDEDGEYVALKCSQDIISITKEYNFLTRFKSKSFVPKVYELDDFTQKGEVYHFFSMEYIYGDTLKSAVKGRRLSFKAKINTICLISKIIKAINDDGYIYTDLKFENIMIDKKNGMVKLIDFGSLVKIGSSVKEYTPMYDRMCWGKGSRIADMSYQIFAIAILMVSLLIGRGLDPGRENLDSIIGKLRQDKIPKRLFDVISRSIHGKIASCDKLYDEMSIINTNSNLIINFDTVLNAIIVVLFLILSIMVFLFVY